MPMHDWTRVERVLFHHFHQQWSALLADALNGGLLPNGLSALIERHSRKLVPNERSQYRRDLQLRDSPYGVATAPQTRMRIESQGAALLRRANRIAIRHRLGDVVCVIEIVSPGNKASKSAVRKFVEKSMEFLNAGVNLLLVDPYPSGPRDPQSLHKLIWDEIDEETPFEMPTDEPLLLASYRAGDDAAELPPVAYLEPFKVGAPMPDMPAWLDPDSYVPVPLERTYMAAWEVCPADFRYLVEHGRLPDE